MIWPRSPTFYAGLRSLEADSIFFIIINILLIILFVPIEYFIDILKNLIKFLKYFFKINYGIGHRSDSFLAVSRFLMALY